MNQKGPLRLAWLVLFLASGSRGLEGVQMIMPNGSRVVVEAEDIAVDIADAAGRALPEDEGELKNLLNWAISEHSVLCIPAPYSAWDLPGPQLSMKACTQIIGRQSISATPRPQLAE